MIYTYMHAITIMRKVVLNVKESRGGNMGRFGRKKGKREML